MTAILNTKQFTKVEKTLVAEASCIFGKGRLPMEFQLQSQWTGNVETFRHAKTEFDGEGDILTWAYVPVNSKVKTSIMIFND